MGTKEEENECVMALGVVSWRQTKLLTCAKQHHKTFHDNLGQGRTLKAAADPLYAIWGIFDALSK